jgi:hypothetical protein
MGWFILVVAILLVLFLPAVWGDISHWVPAFLWFALVVLMAAAIPILGAITP